MQENVKIWHLLQMDNMLDNFDEAQSKEWETFISPDFHADSETGR